MPRINKFSLRPLVWVAWVVCGTGTSCPAAAQILSADNTAAGQSAAASAEPESTGGGWLPLPRITMPTVTWPSIQMPTLPASPIEPLKASVRKIGDGGRKMWEGTKELLHIGQPASPPVARVARREEPSLWKRMLGATPPEDEGPRTIGEFMSGTRPQ
jgi:hypothetical protein